MAVIEVENLIKNYGGTNVVDGISFGVEAGEIFGIVGPNGAGKTTTVESVSGLRVPDGGSISVLGLDPQRDHYEVAQRVGVQLQESRLQDKIRVHEALELYASFYDTPADWGSLLDRLGLEGKANAGYSSLSGGQKQRLAIALALIGTPEIAILDELTTGLDPQARRDVWGTIEQIRDSGVTVVLVTHFMEEAERLCDRIMVVDQGRVLALDTPSGLIKRIGAGQVIRFRPSAEVADSELSALPGVEGVLRKGEMVEIAGTDDAVHAVTSFLAQRQIIAHELRIEQNSLEDAYLALTKEGK
ncbi:MAG: ABC transporter ATP-binding protein [Acidimicrobiia bacterium]|nr:ABC transporter ATP-binding protein [Acidimicrobiia bacterium]